MIRHALLGAVALALPAGALAQETINVTASPIVSPFTVAERSVPAQLSPGQREQYARIFRSLPCPGAHCTRPPKPRS
jgi:hypothetical protein